jgi:hypothetical protein
MRIIKQLMFDTDIPGFASADSHDMPRILFRNIVSCESEDRVKRMQRTLNHNFPTPYELSSKTRQCTYLSPRPCLRKLRSMEEGAFRYR